jgi:hypothetical protein
MPRLTQTQTTELHASLRPRVEDRQRLIAERDRILAEIATVSDDIATRLALADEKSVRVGPYLVVLVENQGRQTLDKHRLVELGVSPETIQQATTRGAPSVSLQIRTASEE